MTPGAGGAAPSRSSGFGDARGRCSAVRALHHPTRWYSPREHVDLEDQLRVLILVVAGVTVLRLYRFARFLAALARYGWRPATLTRTSCRGEYTRAEDPLTPGPGAGRLIDRDGELAVVVGAYRLSTRFGRLVNVEIAGPETPGSRLTRSVIREVGSDQQLARGPYETTSRTSRVGNPGSFVPPDRTVVAAAAQL